MKRAVIVHCWEGRPNYCWYPHTKKELEQLGYSVAVPFFETGKPILKNRIPKLEEIIEEPDEELVLIGHSIGVATIMKYLETLEQGQKVKACIFVAGFTDDLGYEELSNFFENDVDLAEVKRHCDHILAIHSDNDPYVPLSQGENLKEKLGAELIVKPGSKHFSGKSETDTVCLGLPEIVEFVKKLDA